MVESREDELASIRLGPVTLVLPHRGVAEGPAELSIRPQSLLLSRNMGELTGQVAKAYVGSHIEYWINLGGIDRELFVIAPDIEAPFAVGDPVKVRLAPDGLALLPQRCPN